MVFDLGQKLSKCVVYLEHVKQFFFRHAHLVNIFYQK